MGINGIDFVCIDEQEKLKALHASAPKAKREKKVSTALYAPTKLNANGHLKEKPITFKAHTLHPSLHLPSSRSPSPPLEPETHVESQKKLREETIAAFHQPGQNEEEEDDELFVVREDNEQAEEGDYKEFLEKSVKGGVDEIRELIIGDSGGGGGIEHSPPSDPDDDESSVKKKSKKKRKDKGKEKRNDNADQDFLLKYAFLFIDEY